MTDRSLPAVDRLTERERQVLQLIAKGFTSREIAEAWGLSIHTIRTYRERVLTKLHCHDIRSAVHLAGRSGVIEA